MTVKSDKYKCILQSKTTEKAAPNNTFSPFSKNAPSFVPYRGIFGRALLFNHFLLKPAFTSLSLLSFVPSLNSKKTQTVKNHTRRRLSNKAVIFFFG
jgi:nitrate reductase alpha subunit